MLFSLFFLSLFTLSLAHMRMTQPAPKFTINLGDANQPVYQGSGKCDLVNPGQEALAKKPTTFASKLKHANFPNLRAYVDACARKSNSNVCGNTDRSKVVGFPAGGKFELVVGADHVGLMEVWIDDQLAFSNSGTNPTSAPIDFTKFCSPGKTCLTRFVQASLHVELPEIYDNCVGINSEGKGSGPQASVPASVPAPSTPEPVPSMPAHAPLPTPEYLPAYTPPSTPEPVVAPCVKAPVVITTTVNSAPTDIPSKEWTCKGATLLRTVGSTVYEFPCGAGTTCKVNPTLNYAICDFP